VWVNKGKRTSNPRGKRPGEWCDAGHNKSGERGNVSTVRARGNKPVQRVADKQKSGACFTTRKGNSYGAATGEDLGEKTGGGSTNQCS